MGWSSGGELFDAALDVFLVSTPYYIRKSQVAKWYEAFKWTDWDTQQESKYFEDYLKDIMIKNGELDQCPTCKDIQYDEYNGEGTCYNEECPDSEYYEEPDD